MRLGPRSWAVDCESRQTAAAADSRRAAETETLATQLAKHMAGSVMQVTCLVSFSDDDRALASCVSAGGEAFFLTVCPVVETNCWMRRSSEYLEEGYGVSYQVQNLTVSKLRREHFF
eukprot:COSAG01_NODE_19417_length_1010_cov_2.001098_1_plen_116_part_10